MKIETIKFLQVNLGDSLSEAESFAVKISKNKQMWTKKDLKKIFLNIYLIFILINQTILEYLNGKSSSLIL